MDDDIVDEIDDNVGARYGPSAAAGGFVAALQSARRPSDSRAVPAVPQATRAHDMPSAAGGFVAALQSARGGPSDSRAAGAALPVSRAPQPQQQRQQQQQQPLPLYPPQQQQQQQRWSFPVQLPAASLRPPKAVGPSLGELRTRDTVIVKRAAPPPPAAMVVRPAPPPSPPPRPPGEGGVWHASHLEELTHGREARERAAQKAEAQAAEAAAAFRREHRLYVHGGFLGRSPIEHLLGNRSSGSGASDFLERQDAATRTFHAKRADASLAADYAARVDKKCCPECGTPQSFDEWKNGVKRCPRDKCGGAVYRPKKVWADFQREFVEKWRQDLEGRAEKLKRMEKVSLSG
jgi:hypothetical protein